jgi:hypothetical protein
LRVVQKPRFCLVKNFEQHGLPNFAGGRMDGNKIILDFFDKSSFTPNVCNQRVIHMSVGVILFLLWRKKGQKNGSCQWIIKLLKNARIIVDGEKRINLTRRNVSAAAKFDEVNFL